MIFDSKWDKKEVETIWRDYPEYVDMDCDDLQQTIDDLNAAGQGKIEEGYELQNLADTLSIYLKYKKREAKETSIQWKPLYANNMIDNPKEGEYCIISDPEHKLVRKYTILYQHGESEEGFSLSFIENYVLFEKGYTNIVGPSEHPAPSHNPPDWNDTYNTFNAQELNDYGTFIRAFVNEGAAKMRALTQYNHIAGLVGTYV
jgi:hypothetical protein